MAYTNSFIFAVDKKVLSLNLLHPFMPPFLLDIQPTERENAFYWDLSADSNQEALEIQEAIEAMFDYVIKSSPHDMWYSDTLFGGYRIGEEITDIEEYGKPDYFGIHLNIDILSPIEG